MNVIAELNGRPVVDLRVNLRRGATPSRFEALLPVCEVAAGDTVTLRAGDGAGARIWRQFIVESVEQRDGLTLVRGADARAAWSRRPVHAHINVPTGDGTAFEPASTDNGEPLTLQAAIGRLFFAAGVAVSSALAANGPSPHGLALAGVPLNVALERTLAAVGLTFTIGDDGGVEIAPADQAAATPDAARLVEKHEHQSDIAPAEIIGGAPLELRRISGWQTVICGDGSDQRPQGEFFDLGEMLAAWGVPPTKARRACLSDGGFEQLLPSTGARYNPRLAALRELKNSKLKTQN